MRELLGWYPADLFLRIGSRRPPVWSLWPSESAPLSDGNVDALFPSPADQQEHQQLLNDFEFQVNSQYCVFDGGGMRELRDQMNSLNASGSSPSSLVRARLYTTLVLGQASRTQRDMNKGETINSARLVAPCAQIAKGMVHFSGDSVLLPQTLYLLAV